MSRLSRFLRSLPCRWMGGHLPSPVTIPPVESSSMVVSECLRCHLPLARWSPVSKDLFGSPSGVLTWEPFGAPTPAEYAALRLGWEQALGFRTSPSQKDRDTESASAPNGAGR